MADLDLFDAEAFNQAFSDASRPYFEPERLSDFSLLAKRRQVTMAQAVLLMLSAPDDSCEGDLAHAYGDYIRLMAFAVTEQKLEARHPATLLTWAQCMEMLRGGIYGPAGERAPMLHFGWLVGLDDVTAWMASFGFVLNVTGLLKELEGNDSNVAKREGDAKKWTNALIEEVRQFRASHSAKETADHFGVSDSFIRRKLKPAAAGGIDPWKGLQ